MHPPPAGSRPPSVLHCSNKPCQPHQALPHLQQAAAGVGVHRGLAGGQGGSAPAAEGKHQGGEGQGVQCAAGQGPGAGPLALGTVNHGDLLGQGVGKRAGLSADRWPPAPAAVQAHQQRTAAIGRQPSE